MAWWKENGTIVRTRKRKASEQVSGGKEKVQATVVNDNGCARFNNLLKNMKGVGNICVKAAIISTIIIAVSCLWNAVMTGIH